MGHTSPSATIGRGHTIYIYISGMVPQEVSPSPGNMSPFAHILVPSVVSMIWVSITSSLRPDEAVLDLAWQKLVYTNKINFVTAIQEVM